MVDPSKPNPHDDWLGIPPIPPAMPGASRPPPLPVLPLSYTAGAVAPRYGKPVAISILAIGCMLLSAVNVVLGIYSLGDLYVLRAKAAPTAQPATPATPMPTPGLKPMSADFRGPAGLPLADRERLAAYVATQVQTMTPDRALVLDQLLAEVGQDFAGAPGLPGSLSAFRVSQSGQGPDVLPNSIDTVPFGTIRMEGPGGVVEINNTTGRLLYANGTEASIASGVFKPVRPAAPVQWSARLIEYDLARHAQTRPDARRQRNRHAGGRHFRRRPRLAHFAGAIELRPGNP